MKEEVCYLGVEKIERLCMLQGLDYGLPWTASCPSLHTVLTCFLFILSHFGCGSIERPVDSAVSDKLGQGQRADITFGHGRERTELRHGQLLRVSSHATKEAISILPRESH
jgi:hypothetical protein